MTARRRAGAALLSLVLITAAARAAEPAPFVDLEAYLRARADDSFTLLDQPQVRCLVSRLLPEADLAALQARLDRRKGSEHLLAFGPDGGLLTEGSWPAAGRCEVGLLWLHPDGRLYGIVREGCGGFRAFTNVPALIDAPPPAVAAWLERVKRPRERVEAWHVGADAGPSPRCSLSAQRDAIAADAARRAGTLCDEMSPMNGPLAVVAPAGGTQTSVRSKRACPQGGKPEKRYLVAGDLVETGFSADGCTCVVMRRSESFIAGWVAAADLRELPVDGGWWPGAAPDAMQSFRALMDSLPAPPPMGGTWVAPQTTLTIRSEDGVHWTVAGDGAAGYRVGRLDGTLARDGRLAQSEPPADEAASDTACRIAVIQFNNALWVEGRGECGGVGFSFDGVYRRERPLRSR